MTIMVVECGRVFRSPGGGALALTGRFPAWLPVGAATVSGTVGVSSAGVVRGVISPRADVLLVRDGRVVAVPLPRDLLGVRLDLLPGETWELPGETALVSCEPGGALLSAAWYELYVRVVLSRDDGDLVESVGGPWVLELR